MAFARFALVCLAVASLGACARAAEVPADEAFAGRVRPFLVQHCQECHTGEKPKGDFRLDRLAADFDNRPTANAGRPCWSRSRRARCRRRRSRGRRSKDVQALSDWIGRQVEAAGRPAGRGGPGRAAPPQPGRVREHRARPAGRGRRSEGPAARRTARRTASTTSARRCTSPPS